MSYDEWKLRSDRDQDAIYGNPDNQEESCPQCDGAGIWDEDYGTRVNIGPPCPKCGGHGYVKARGGAE